MPKWNAQANGHLSQSVLAIRLFELIESKIVEEKPYFLRNYRILDRSDTCHQGLPFSRNANRIGDYLGCEEEDSFEQFLQQDFKHRMHQHIGIFPKQNSKKHYKLPDFVVVAEEIGQASEEVRVVLMLFEMKPTDTYSLKPPDSKDHDPQQKYQQLFTQFSSVIRVRVQVGNNIDYRDKSQYPSQYPVYIMKLQDLKFETKNLSHFKIEPNQKF